MNQPVIISRPGRVPYEPTWRAMQSFTDARQGDTTDEIWLLEHPPVFTQGMAGRPEHILHAGDIPVIPIDRGGQVTFHGPGQVVAYLLIDIRRRGWGVRQLVQMLEQAVIDLLADYGIAARGDRDAPGVYVDGAKIAALGLRIRRHASYHGLSLNVDMDLEPFSRINPCGHAGLRVTQMKDFGVRDDPATVAEKLEYHLCRVLGYNAQP